MCLRGSDEKVIIHIKAHSNSLITGT